jgi:2-dehydropantoate 2-reductase
VSLLTTDRAHVQAILERGLLVEELDGSVTCHRLSAFTDPGSMPEKADLVLVSVKTYDTEAALSSVQACTHHGTWYLTVQNGIGNHERIARLVDPSSIMVGVTLIEPGRIRHGGNGLTFVGEVEGPPSARVDQVVEILRASELKAEASDSMQKIIWEKLVINVGINSITALTGIPNGVLVEVDAARELSEEAVKEALKVAGAKGFPLGDDMVEKVFAVARATAVNRSSMGQDVDRHAPTEIDAINGAIVDYGNEFGIPVPVNRALTQLIRTLEAGYSRTGRTGSC